jgi:hypothetical protein
MYAAPGKPQDATILVARTVLFHSRSAHSSRLWKLLKCLDAALVREVSEEI